MAEDKLKIMLSDGTRIVCSFMEAQDRQKVIKFLRGLPMNLRFFLPSDVMDDVDLDLFLSAIDNKFNHALLAWSDEKVVGFGMLMRPRYGWTSHIGEILVVIGEEFQHKRLGIQIVRELFTKARKTKLEHLFGYILASEKSVIDMFEKAGFQKTCFLRNFGKLPNGKTTDVVLLTRSVEELWKQLEEYIDSMGRKHEH